MKTSHLDVNTGYHRQQAHKHVARVLFAGGQVGAGAIFRSVSRFQTHTPESGDGIGLPEAAEFDDMRMSPFPDVLILLSPKTFAMNK